VQRHHERIRKSCFIKVAVDLCRNDASVATLPNLIDIESDVGAKQLFIAPFLYSGNSLVLVALVSDRGRLCKVREKKDGIVIVSSFKGSLDRFVDE
jgi:hypothetical protein